MRNADRRPTLTDVAVRAGVSKSLVSIVMRDEPGASAETRRRILEAADQLGYHPDRQASLLRSGRSRLLGVVFGIQHAFHADLVTDLYTAARETGYELALSAITPDRDEKEAITGLLRDRCEALILLGPQSPTAELVRLTARMPVVAVARGVRSAAVDVVRSADARGIDQAVDHLVGLGHRAITHIDGGRAPGAAERRRAYREAMHRHGIGNETRVIPGGLTEEDGVTAARAMLGSLPAALPAASPTTLPAALPTAVIVFNDRCATGVLHVLTQSGVRVPDDVSVVGYDDSRLARLAHINLTTVAQDTATMTRLAVNRAIDRIDAAPTGHRELVVPPLLVIRGTTATPRLL